MEAKLRLARVLSFGAKVPSDLEFSWNGVELKKGIYALAKSLSNMHNTLSSHQTIDNWINRHGAELDGHAARIRESSTRAPDKRVLRMYLALNSRHNEKAKAAPKRPPPQRISTYEPRHLPMLTKRLKLYEKILEEQNTKIDQLMADIAQLEQKRETKKPQKGRYKTQDLELDEDRYHRDAAKKFSASLDLEE